MPHLVITLPISLSACDSGVILSIINPHEADDFYNRGHAFCPDAIGKRRQSTIA
jgi:hypothetical protein